MTENIISKRGRFSICKDDFLDSYFKKTLYNLFSAEINPQVCKKTLAYK